MNLAWQILWPYLIQSQVESWCSFKFPSTLPDCFCTCPRFQVMERAPSLYASRTTVSPRLVIVNSKGGASSASQEKNLGASVLKNDNDKIKYKDNDTKNRNKNNTLKNDSNVDKPLTKTQKFNRTREKRSQFLQQNPTIIASFCGIDIASTSQYQLVQGRFHFPSDSFLTYGDKNESDGHKQDDHERKSHDMTDAEHADADTRIILYSKDNPCHVQFYFKLSRRPPVQTQHQQGKAEYYDLVKCNVGGRRVLTIHNAAWKFVRCKGEWTRVSEHWVFAKGIKIRASEVRKSLKKQERDEKM